MKADIQNYFNWLRERGLRFPVKAYHPATIAKPQLAFMLATADLSDSEQRLFDKILKATKLPENQLLILKPELPLNELPKQVKGIIIFGSDIAEKFLPQRSYSGKIKNLQANTLIPAVITHHPREMLKKPALKIQVWKHLQGVLASLPS